MTKNKLSIADIKKAVAPVAEKYGVKRVFLFGSYARGDNTEESDIDLRCEGGDIYGPWMSNGFQDDMQNVLGMKVDVVNPGNPNSEFLQRISSDHVLLYEEGADLESPIFIPAEQGGSSFLSKSQRDAIILKKVLKYCDEVNQAVSHFGDNFETFEESSVYRGSASMGILQIGEHSNRLSDDFKARFTDMPWPKIKAMRNVIAHEYYEMDIAILWKIVCEYVPELQEYCKKVLLQLQQEGEK